jgi:hypothetical protein
MNGNHARGKQEETTAGAAHEIDPSRKSQSKSGSCPWLIQKFIDAEAEFVFLPTGTNWSKVTEGTVYDVPNCELGHHGEDVSFDSILKKFQLNDPALLLLADIVRAADSHPSNPHSSREGLRWIAHGFSTLGFSDHDILSREFIVYDALYAECQRRVTAGVER